MSAARRQPTRRGLIAGGASALAAGALLPAAPVIALQIDRDLIDLLFAQEQMQIAWYAAILETFDDAAFAAAGLPENTRRNVEEILAAEQAHRAVVTRADGPQSLAPPPPALSDVLDALREAAALENLAVASYALVIPELDRQRLIPDLLGIHSVEARHASWLATLLGEAPFPDAIDAPLTLEESTGELPAPPDDRSPAGTPVAATEMEPIVAAIAQELGVSADAVSVLDITPQDWPDSSLGCPQPDMLYAQVVTPGYQVLVEVSGEEIEFHTDTRGAVVRCP